MAENVGYEVLHGIVDCLWIIGEPISMFKEAVERETGILTEVDTYDWITFLPMSDGIGAYNYYVFTGNKIRPNSLALITTFKNMKDT